MAGLLTGSVDSAHALAITFRALGHPIRLEILKQLERLNQASAADLAGTRINDPLGSISYHFRVLAQAGLIELARTEQRRGASKRLYRLSQRGQRVSRWADLWS